MDAIFLKLFNMSITASWLVLAVVILRLALKKAPKVFSCLLWVLVAIRLACPFSLESAFSLVPSTDTVPKEIVYAKEPAIDSGVTVINNVVNPIITESFAPTTELTSVNPIQVWLAVVWNVWVLGIIAMLIYTLISYIRLRKKTSASIEIEKGVYICDGIDTPFILGVFKPRIFLPSAMDEKNTEYVLAHEKAHLKRFDHLWKPLGFLLLTVYWFNPVMWAAYILFCRDIELACDERVIKHMGVDEKKAYTSALLACSIPRKMISACPLAFGEVGVKQRIKGVLNYKKPSFWLIVAALIASVAVAVCFLTDPITENESAGQPDDVISNDNPDVSYNSTDISAIVGTWSAPMTVMGLDESDIPDSPTEYFIFNADGTGTERTNVDIMGDKEFVYSTENGIVTITYRSDGGVADDDMVQFRYSVEGDTLTLSDINDPSRTGTLTREKSDIKATQSTAGKLGMVFYGEYALPQNPKEIDRLYFEFTQEGDVSVLSGDSIQYFDDVKMNGLEGTTPEFSFRINSDAYRYAKSVMDALQTVATVSTATNSVVWNRYDRLGAANACVNVTMNDVDAAVSSVRYVDFGEYIFVAVTFGIEKQLRPGDISSFTFEIDPAAAVGSIIDVLPMETDKGYCSKFALRVGDRLAWFEAEDIEQERSIYVSDLTGDGIDEIIVVLQSNSGTGFYGEDIHIFDSITLDEYRVEKVCDTIGNYVTFYDDEDSCYIKIGDAVSTVDKNVFYPDYEKKDMRARPLTDENYSYSVSDGVLRCELKCKYTTMGTYGSILVDYVFKGGMFVYGTSNFVE